MNIEPEPAWSKSSYSTGDGGECIEVACPSVALPASGWFKSSHSTGSGGECIEVAVRPRVVHVRDSKDISQPGLAIDSVAWAAFVGFAVR